MVLRLKLLLLKVVQVTTDLRQSNAVSPILFNIVLEKVVRKVIIGQEGFRLRKTNIGILAYADDLVLFAQNKDKLKDKPNN